MGDDEDSDNVGRRRRDICCCWCWLSFDDVVLDTSCIRVIALGNKEENGNNVV
jgi:hypothetical protein